MKTKRKNIIYNVFYDSTGELIKTYPQDAKIDTVTDYYRCMSFNKDGTLLATSGENKQICVWDTQDWTVKNTKYGKKSKNFIRVNSSFFFV